MPALTESDLLWLLSRIAIIFLAAARRRLRYVGKFDSRDVPVAVPALRSVSILSRSGCRQTMQVRGMRRSYIQRGPIFPSRVVLCFPPAPDRYSAHVEVSRRGGIASANATPARTYLKGAISTGNAMTLRN
jgi:hypothetical protein